MINMNLCYLYIMPKIYAIHRTLAVMSGKQPYDKLWDGHAVRRNDDGTCLIYRSSSAHEVTSPQAFEGSGLGQTVAGDANPATADHNVPTTTSRSRHCRPGVAAAGRDARSELP
jgi:homoaconitase/3-isopropylmalate dehydratase large subunit